MPFFGPGGLGSTKSQQGLDPQLLDALMQQFPGLAQLGQGTQPQAPNALQGYQWPGTQFAAGQGQQGFGNLSPFEGAKGFGSESITAGLALGNYGKSSSQTPAGSTAQPFNLGQLSLPSLALPQAVAAQQGGYGDGLAEAGAMGEGAEGAGGITIGAGDVLGAGEQVAGLFNTGTGTAFDPTGQMQSSAAQQQRAGERDYSNLTGSPSGIPLSQTLSQFGQATGLSAPGVQPMPTSAPTGFGDATFSMGGGSPLAPGGFQAESFTMPGEAPTMSAPGGSAQFALGQQGDLLGGGLSTLGGLANLISGVQSGNVGGVLSGAGSTLSGIGQLFPGSGISGGGLELAGGAVGAPMAVMGLVQGIDEGDPMAIASNLAAMYGTTVPVINALFGTTLPSLTSVAGSALASLGSTMGGTIGSAISSIGSFLGGGAAAGGAAGAGAAAGAAGAAGGAGAGGATAAAGAVAAPLAMVMGPYIVAQLIQMAQTMGPDKKNAAQLASRVENIVSQLPGMLSQIQGVPDITAQLTNTSTPEQAADILRQLNTLQDQYQAGGWESHQKTGGTSVSSVGEGNMQVDLPEVKNALDAQNAYFHLMDVNRLRAQDVLGGAGWTPEQITAQTGRYIGPQEWAMNLSGNARVGGQGENAEFPDYQSSFMSAFKPTYEPTWNPAGWMNEAPTPEQTTTSSYGVSPGGLTPGMGQTGLLGTPMGNVSRSMWDQLGAIAPGNFEQGLNQFLAQYGGVNPGMVQAGFGQGLQAPTIDPVTQQLQQFQQQLQGLQGGLGQVSQGLQQQPAQGMDPALLTVMQSANPGFAGGMNTGGNAGVDLQALLRQLGLVAA